MVKNALKILSGCSGGSPTPVSLTKISTLTHAYGQLTLPPVQGPTQSYLTKECIR